MKIGILTQPLQNNYGGILQAYALQKVLTDMGHEVLTVDRRKKVYFFRKILSVVKRIILRYIFRKKIKIRTWLTKKETIIISEHTRSFIEKNINLTEKIDSEDRLKNLENYKLDAYIVGSDQVWRPKYSPNIYNYFLDFIKEKKTVKRIAYAASFGVDNWEFSPEQTAKCKKLVKYFDVISVREDSGVTLCKKHFDIDALHLLDPTMLLNVKEYMLLAEKSNTTVNTGNLLVYVLDKSVEKEEIISDISSRLNLNPFYLMPEHKFQDLPEKIDSCKFKPVEQWLSGFLNAKFIITDSFHGTVFSILFNKPFFVFQNYERGNARIYSLLKQFGLQNRIINDEKQILSNELINDINFEPVNVKIEKERNRSLEFLKNHLSNKND